MASLPKRMEQAIIEHEHSHLKNIVDLVDGVEFFKRPDSNNIDHVVHGRIYVDINKLNLEQLTRIVDASNVQNQSKQDIAFRDRVNARISRLRQIK